VGGDKQFAVRDANFQAYGAEKAYSGMHLAGFTKAPDSRGGPITAIVTFTETGGSTTTIPAPAKPAAESSGGAAPQAAAPAEAAPPRAQNSAAPSPSSSEGSIQDKPDK
jgi:hypothetical protein